MGAKEFEEIEISDFSKEEMRRLEIKHRLEALRIVKPILREYHLTAQDHYQKVVDEIACLEAESDLLSQGQLKLD